MNWIRGSNSLTYDGRKIKTVLAYIEVARVGGAERVACVLCGIWADMGYRVLLLTNEEPTDEDYPLSDKVERIVLQNHANSDYAKGKNYKMRADEWTEILQEYKVDAVVYHPTNWNPNVFLWDVLAIKGNGVAFIAFWHSSFFRPFYNKNRKSHDLFESYCLPDALVVLSETDRAFWKYYNGNVHVTINPLPEDWQDWKCLKLADRHDILWLARPVLLKNPMDLIPIMQEVLLEVPDAVLHVVGKSLDGKTENILSDKIEQEGLGENIVLEGHSLDVKSWYFSSRVFLMTSDIEGYPNALTESKMAGLPCVMYELPYLTLCEGNRGIIPVPQRDTKAAAKAIIRLLKDDELCERYGKEARAHIEELAQFDFQGKWYEIFESVESGYRDTMILAEKRMIDMLVEGYVKEIDRATQAENKDKEFWDIRYGYLFLLVRFVTWFSRKIRGGVKCFRQYGLVYTYKRTLEHFGIDMGIGNAGQRK